MSGGRSDVLTPESECGGNEARTQIGSLSGLENEIVKECDWGSEGPQYH